MMVEEAHSSPLFSHISYRLMMLGWSISFMITHSLSMLNGIGLPPSLLEFRFGMSMFIILADLNISALFLLMILTAASCPVN